MLRLDSTFDKPPKYTGFSRKLQSYNCSDSKKFAMNDHKNLNTISSRVMSKSIVHISDRQGKQKSRSKTHSAPDFRLRCVGDALQESIVKLDIGKMPQISVAVEERFRTSEHRPFAALSSGFLKPLFLNIKRTGAMQGSYSTTSDVWHLTAPPIKRTQHSTTRDTCFCVEKSRLCGLWRRFSAELVLMASLPIETNFLSDREDNRFKRILLLQRRWLDFWYTSLFGCASTINILLNGWFLYFFNSHSFIPTHLIDRKMDRSYSFNGSFTSSFIMNSGRQQKIQGNRRLPKTNQIINEQQLITSN